MLQRLIRWLLVLSLGSPVVADDSLPFPKQVPPILGTAVATESANGDELSEWRIGLTVPKIRWGIVGQLVPRKEWPQLKAEVEKVSLIVRMGGPSQLAESRVVDMEGKELRREEILRRLAKEKPVLVSVSGEMPDAYFLQLTSADALIVILGPRDGYPAPGLLPAKLEAGPKPRKDVEK